MEKEKDLIRLDKYLGDLGYGTRKELKEVIRKGYVTVDGEAVKRPETKVSIKESRIALDGEVLNYQKNVYLIMNKPPGVISATSDPYGAETPVTELLSDDYYFLGLFPVGRLDKDAAGLLILTNDGKFNHGMTSPKKGKMKTYYCVVKGTYQENQPAAVAAGIEIDGGYQCRPGELYTLDAYIAKTGKTYLIEQCREFIPETVQKENTYEAVIRISEGKFHQVKRMFQAMGQEVQYLKRIGFADYDLPQGLAEGEVEEIFPFGEE
jgi:16S rRNA pseudouridine516 synthase